MVPDRSLLILGVNDHPHNGWLGFCRQRRQKTGKRSVPIDAGETGCKATGLENPIKWTVKKNNANGIT
jgi:hypothetical protein